MLRSAPALRTLAAPEETHLFRGVVRHRGLCARGHVEPRAEAPSLDGRHRRGLQSADTSSPGVMKIVGRRHRRAIDIMSTMLDRATRPTRARAALEDYMRQPRPSLACSAESGVIQPEEPEMIERQRSPAAAGTARSCARGVAGIGVEACAVASRAIRALSGNRGQRLGAHPPLVPVACMSLPLSFGGSWTFDAGGSASVVLRRRRAATAAVTRAFGRPKAARAPSTARSWHRREQRRSRLSTQARAATSGAQAIGIAAVRDRTRPLP